MTPPAALPHATPLRHPRLPRETVWETVGDPTLLDAATFVPVILSRRLKGEALETELAWILAAAQTGAVAIGGFVSPGERIAQLLVMPVCRAEFVQADSMEDTARGQGGFGSTGRTSLPGDQEES